MNDGTHYSTVIKTYRCGKVVEEEPTKVNVFLSLVGAALAFVPYAQIIIIIIAPIMTLVWFCSNNFDNDDNQKVEISNKTFIGKILLFKI